MASRLNTKFALTLAGVSITAGAVLVGLALLAYRANTTRHIKAGDQLMAIGDFESALNEYGRAVSKEKSDLSHLRKFEQALVQIRPQTQEQAKQYYGQLTGVLRHELRYRPFDAEVHIELLEELRSTARLVNQASVWGPVYDAAEEMQAGVPRSDPMYSYAKLYKGLANLRRNPVPTDAQVQEALRDLSEFIEVVPDSDVGWAGQVEALLATAQLARVSGNKLSSEEALRGADEMLERALEAVEDGPEVSRLYALRLLQRQDQGDATVTQEEIGQALDRMVELIAESNDPLLLLGAVDILRYADRTEGMSTGIRLLADYLSDHPEDHLQRFALANLYFHSGAFEDAQAQAQVIIDAEPVLVSLLAVYQPYLRIRAAELMVDVEYEAWEKSPEAERASRLQRARTARDRMAELVVDPDNEPLMLQAEGKIAMAEGNYLVAADMFERAIRTVDVPEFEVLWYATLALEQIGEFGSALMRIDDALEVRPGSVFLLRQKARLEARLGRIDDAIATIEQALRKAPEDEQSQLMAERILERKTSEEASLIDPIARAISDARAKGEDGDLDTARSILLDALQEHGEDDTRLLYFLTLLEIEAEQLDAAGEYLDRAIQLQPNNAPLLSLQASLGIEDPIERLKRAIAARYSDEPSRSLAVLIGLRRRAWELERLADRHAAAADAASEASARDLSARAHQEADVMLVRAHEIAPGHPMLLDHLIGEAIRAEDWETADAVLQQAREQNTDQADGLIFKGRYELARSQTEQAVQTLTAATKRKPYSAIPWQLLGRAYELLGDNSEARRAYEEAYTRAPSDQTIVRLYVNLLERAEDTTRALSVLRDSRRLVDRDQLLQDAWLRLEADIGDSVLAIRMRREIYDLLPGNRLNAMRLAQLLGRANPSFEHVSNEAGVQAFDLDRWRSIPAAKRTEMLEQLAAQWISESNEILEAAEAQIGDTLELAFLRANIARGRGALAAGEQVLADFMDRRQEDELTAAMFVALGRYQQDTNRVREARATFEKGRAYQDPQLREADRALIDLLFAARSYQGGIDLCNELLEINHERALVLRVVEGYLGLGEFDQADQRLRELVEAHGIDFRSTMLEASLAGRQAGRLYADGQVELATEKYQLQRRVLARGESLRPDDPTPHVQTAQSFLRQFTNTGMRSFLDEAIVALDLAGEIRASSTSVSTVRVDVYLAMGDLRAAIGELTRLLVRSPDNVRARALLVTVYENQGELDAAIGTIDAAIERYPLESVWYDARGELLLRQKQLEPAAKSYAEAYRLSPTKKRLTILTDILLDLESPNIAQIVKAITELGSLLEAEPKLRSLYARALHRDGQHETALDQLRIAYREYGVEQDEEVAVAAQTAWLRAVRELFAGGQFQELEEFVFEVSDAKPTVRELNAMARFWAGAGPDGRSRAMELQLRALEQTPEDDTQLRVTMLIELGLLALSAQDYRAAIEAFDRAIELDPNNATALNNAAFLYGELLGDPSKALVLAERANEIRPDSPELLDTLGWIQYQLQQFEEAENALRRSLEHRESAVSFFHLASVLFKQDRLRAAETYLKRAMELRPDPETRAEMERLQVDITRAQNR